MRRTCFLPAALVMIVLLIALWIHAQSADRVGTAFGDKPFNAAAWRAMAKSENREGRAKMARDLIDHHLRAGMPEAETVLMLGRQDKTWPASEHYPPLRHDVYEYDMGHAPLDGAGQHYVLRLYFDGQGQYQRAEITRD